MRACCDFRGTRRIVYFTVEMRCLGTGDLSHLDRRWCYPDFGRRLQNKAWASQFILQMVQEARRALEVSVPSRWLRVGIEDILQNSPETERMLT